MNYKKQLMKIPLLVLALFMTAGVMLGQVSYTQTWAATGLNSWTTSGSVFSRTTSLICGTTGSIRGERWFGNSGQFNSPLLGTSNAGLITMTYQYKVTNWSAGTAATSAANVGTITLEYASSTSGPWTVAQTINSSNHIASTSCATKTATFSPPAGNLYVRFNVTSSANNDSWYYFDEVSVSQGAAPTCFVPASVSTASVTSSSATLNWPAASPAPANGYQWEVRSSGAAGSGATGLTASGTVAAGVLTANATGLAANTVYTVYVRSSCGGGDFSTWASSTFTTLCSAFSTFPWTETFDATSTTEGCWSKIDANADGDIWNLNGTTIPRSGEAAQLYTDFNTSNNDYLITPQLDLGATGKRMKFWVRHNSNGEPDNLRVRVSTTGKATTDFTTTLLTLSTTQITTTYTEYTVNLSAYTGLVYLAFTREDAPADGWYVSIDDVTFEEIPVPTIISFTPSSGCPSATSVVITGTNFTGATAVSIGGTAVASYVVNSATQITATVGAGTTGTISVTASGITATSSGTFTFLTAPSAPTCAGVTVSPGSSATLNASGGGGTFDWFTTATGGTSIFTGASFAAPASCSNATYYVEENNGSCSGPRTAVVVTVESISLAKTPANGLICAVGESVNMVASGVTGASYTWTGAGLDTNTGATVNATPSATTQYVVSTIVGGCTLTATANVGIISGAAPVPSATPSLICSGNTVQLDANLAAGNFGVASIPYAAATPSSATSIMTGGTANVALSGGTLDDGGWSGIPIGFSYNFFGSSFSTISAGTNGLLMFGTPPGYGTNPGELGQFSFATTPATFPNTGNPGNVIALLASDLNCGTTGTGSSIKYWNDGIAPTRRFIIEYKNVPDYGTAANLTTVQAILYETTGVVEVHIASCAAGTGTHAKTCGLQDATKTIGAVAPGRQVFTTAISTSEAWRFSPPANYTYAWSPSSNLSATNVQAPTVLATAPSGSYTYTVTVTNPITGCASDGSVNLTINQSPGTPTVVNSTECSNPVTPSASVASTSGLPTPTFKWYDAASGGNLLQTSTSTTFTTPISATTTWYVAELSGTCESPRVAVTATVPSLPTISSSAMSTCDGTPVTLTAATQLVGSTVTWSGTGIATPNANPTSAAPSGTSTYTVTETLGACSLVSLPITITAVGASNQTVTTAPAAACGGLGTLTVATSATANIAPVNTWYANDFSSATLNPAEADIAPVGLQAQITSGYLALTENVISQSGSFEVKNPNAINPIALSVDYDFTTNVGSTSNSGADGFSWSFGDDVTASPLSGASLEESGSGSKLKLSFDGYGTSNPQIQGIYLMYNQTAAQNNTVSTSVLAYSSDLSWKGAGASRHINVVINNAGQLTLKVGSTVIFNNVQLPAGYITSNKSTWKHIFAARTGGVAETHYFDNLDIKYAALEYSTDNTTFQDANTFNLAPGAYNAYVRFKGNASCSVDLGSYTVGGNPTAFAASAAATAPVCSASNINLTFTPALTGATYQWQVSTNGGGAWTDITGGTTAAYTTNQSVSSMYRVVVTCGSSITSTPSAVVTQSPIAACYCIPTYSSGKTSGDLISNISITGTTLSNNSGTAQTNPAYTYFTGQSNYVATLQAGTSYSVNVTVGTWGDQNLRAWIDYNDNGIFETSESIGSAVVAAGQSNTGPFAPASFIISLSCSPPSGLHRLRVRDVWSLTSGFHTSIDPCTSYGFGETEDYDIYITPAPPCPTPSALASGSVAGTSATLTWAPGCTETVWEARVSTSSTAPTAATVATYTNLPAPTLLASSLSANTTYYVWVRAACSPTSKSAWLGPVSFTTLAVNDDICGALSMPLVTNQQSGFGTYNFLSTAKACNSIAGNNTNATIKGSLPAASCGLANGKGLWYKFTAPACAATGAVPFSIQVSTGNSSTNFDTRVRVFSSSDNTCAGTLTEVDCNDDGSGTGCEGGTGTSSNLDFSSAVPGDTYFVYVDGYNATASGNFELSLFMSVPAPTLAVNAISPDKMDISTVVSTPNTYTYYWRPQGSAGYSVDNKTVNTYTTPLLAAGVTYDVQVMHRCASASSQLFRSNVASLLIPPYTNCASTTVSCGTSTSNSITVSWTEQTGAYTAGGALSGYLVYYRAQGTTGYSVWSNPAVTCTGGTCSYTIPNLAPGVTYEIWVLTRCSATATVKSNTVACSTTSLVPMMVANSEENQNDVFTFEHNGIEYHDVKFDELALYGLNLPVPNENVNVNYSIVDGKLVQSSFTGSNLLDNQSFDFVLMPNPTSDQTTVLISTEDLQSEAVISVVDALGRVISTQNVSLMTNGTNVSLETSHLANGVYNVCVKTNSQVVSKKLVVQH